MKIHMNEQTVDIEVKHSGILEVPENKNVDDLPLSHFVKLVDKNGLSKITKALNNLQVWNKNRNPKLSKWASDMIDKLNKKFKKDESWKGSNPTCSTRLHIHEVIDSSNNNWKTSLADTIDAELRKNHIYSYVDIEDVDDKTVKYSIRVDDGDWKHEHVKTNLLVAKVVNGSGSFDLVNLGEDVLDNTESDTYSSIHNYLITNVSN